MAQKEQKLDNDTGLGLSSFLSKSEPASPEKSSPAKVETEVKAKVEAKPDDKKEAAPLKDKEPTKPIEKAAATAPTEAKATAVTEATSDTVAINLKPNWDDENNPWKTKAAQSDQRYRDTHKNWNQLNQQNQELQRQLSILSKKFDGTYDPDKDEPPPPDPTAIRQWGSIEGRAQASYAAATRFHGEEKVMAALNRHAEVFGQDRATQERILQSDDPVQGAMDALDSYDFFAKYGDKPGKIIEAIRAQLETELTPKIAEREAKRVMDELAAKRREPDGLGRVLGSSGATDKQVAKDNAARPKTLSQITGFGH